MHAIEQALPIVSENIWNIFLPILVISAFFIWPKMIFKIAGKVTNPSKINPKESIGAVAISLGAMIGTGAIVGVLGSINKLPAGVKPEAIAVWALVGMLFMIPLVYSEVLMAKVLTMSPKEYISMFVSKTAGKIYAGCFVVLYVFGFGGFQFSGISDAINVVNGQLTGVTFDKMQLYFFIVLPLFIFSSAIILTKKHELFISVLTYMIGVAVVLYLLFLGVFMVETADFMPVYLGTLVDELLNPYSAAFGLPIGLLFGLQRIIQTSEAGLGGLAMSSLESKADARAAAIVMMIPSIITIVIAIVGTTYIASYGLDNGLMVTGKADLASFIKTSHAVAGNLGAVVLILFTILSGLTTLIGSFYFVDVLLNFSANKKIALYMTLIFVAGTLAVFGLDIVFELIDLLMFVVTGLNVMALLVFVNRGKWKQYIIKK